MAKTKADEADFGSMLGKLEVTLEEYFGKKAPQFPKEGKEIIVKFAPYLTILGVVIGVIGLLSMLGLGAFFMPLAAIGMMAGQPFFSFNVILNLVFFGATLLLEGLAIPGLFARSKKAWTFMYWSALVGVVQNVVTFNVGGLIIGGLLSMYFLFQVKEYYK